MFALCNRQSLYHFSRKSSELSSCCCYMLYSISNVLQSTKKKQSRRTAVQQMPMYNGTQPFTMLEDPKSCSKHQKQARWRKGEIQHEATASLKTSGISLSLSKVNFLHCFLMLQFSNYCLRFKALHLAEKSLRQTSGNI